MPRLRHRSCGGELEELITQAASQFDCYRRAAIEHPLPEINHDALRAQT